MIVASKNVFFRKGLECLINDNNHTTSVDVIIFDLGRTNICAINTREFKDHKNMNPLLAFCICKQYSLNRSNRISITSTHRWVKSIHQKRIYKKLTIHETMVIELLMKSFTPYNISKKLNISIKTVSAHKRNALTKLRARNFFCFLKEYNIWLPLWNTCLHKIQSF